MGEEKKGKKQNPTATHITLMDLTLYYWKNKKCRLTHAV